MWSMKSASPREPPTRLRILYYRSVHGPARRGGSAWWSVGLIGFCRSLTAALLGHPEVRGSNPRPDTSVGRSSQTFISWLSIEVESEEAWSRDRVRLRPPERRSSDCQGRGCGKLESR